MHISTLVEQGETDTGCLVMKQELKRLEKEAQQAPAVFQNCMKEAKQKRDHLRKTPSFSAEKEAEFIREGQLIRVELRHPKHR